jgi:hypothetical protein
LKTHPLGDEFRERLGFKSKDYQELMEKFNSFIRLDEPGLLPVWKVAHIKHPKLDTISPLLYQDPLKIIRFLLGHPPFAKDLTWGPVREYNDVNERVYTEAHTANWWWRLQEKLPNHATVVPIQWFSDKTHVTQQMGDRHVHTVYLTVMNLKSSLRRAVSRPACLPVAILPILPKKDKMGKALDANNKRQIFHTCMDEVFKCKCNNSIYLIFYY